LTLPFEEALKRLETIVEIDEAQICLWKTLLARYEEGARLDPALPNKLNEAESKSNNWRKMPKAACPSNH